jgi:hypothetical protein
MDFQLVLHLYSPSVAGHADHFKFCEEMRPVANSALQLFRFDDNEQRWVSESADVDPVNIAAHRWAVVGQCHSGLSPIGVFTHLLPQLVSACLPCEFISACHYS